MNTYPAVTIEREYDAPVERVFRAWTEPDQLKRWFHHATRTWVESAEVEAKVGGNYRIVVKDEESAMVMFGSYTVIDPPKTIEFTWTWEESSLEKGETVVRIDLKPIGNRTHLTLTHSKLSSEQSSQAHDQGWSGVLSTLETYLTEEN
jgi:uncharacterized protein YndB with AHSA1/START domain